MGSWKAPEWRNDPRNQERRFELEEGDSFGNGEGGGGDLRPGIRTLRRRNMLATSTSANIMVVRG